VQIRYIVAGVAGEQKETIGFHQGTYVRVIGVAHAASLFNSWGSWELAMICVCACVCDAPHTLGPKFLYYEKRSTDKQGGIPCHGII
jgi:hypothetical protein